jgi:N-acetylmuramoyl-L-alanine amidase
MRSIKRIVIHCADSKPSMTNVDAREIDRWHRLRGFAEIGYHFVIKRDGMVEEGRDLKDVGAHAVGHNADSIGICMAGGMSEDGKRAENNFTPVQFAALKKLVDKMLIKFPKAELLGHRDLPGVRKECPCFSVRDWWEEAVEKDLDA